MLSRSALALFALGLVAAPVAAQEECEDDGGLLADDGVECTVDVCARGATAHLPDDSRCDDGIACTNDLCTLLGCVSSVIEPCGDDAGSEPDAAVDAATPDGGGDGDGDGDGDRDSGTSPRDASLNDRDAASDGGTAGGSDDGCSCRVGPGASRSARGLAAAASALLALPVLSARRRRRSVGAR